jgi:hypothetical protein
MRIFYKSLFVVFCSSLIVGCSALPEKVALTAEQAKSIEVCQVALPASKKIKKEAVTMGCLATLGFWKAIGQENPGALMCVAGGASGFLLGKSIAERKCAYLTLADQVDGEISHTAKMNGMFPLFFQEQNMQVALIKAQAKGVLAQYQQGQADKKSLEKMHESLAKQLQKEKQFLVQVQENSQFKQETSLKAKPKSIGISEEKQAALSAEIRALIQHIRKLRENIESMDMVNLSLLQSLK